MQGKVSSGRIYCRSGIHKDFFFHPLSESDEDTVQKYVFHTAARPWQGAKIVYDICLLLPQVDAEAIRQVVNDIILSTKEFLDVNFLEIMNEPHGAPRGQLSNEPVRIGS